MEVSQSIFLCRDDYAYNIRCGLLRTVSSLSIIHRMEGYETYKTKFDSAQLDATFLRCKKEIYAADTKWICASCAKSLAKTFHVCLSCSIACHQKHGEISKDDNRNTIICNCATIHCKIKR